jgi:tryptophan synthase alpha chain
VPTRIDDIFSRLRAEGRKALMPFVCGGYPVGVPMSAVLPALERGGASVIEVGIPFSDPIADGPVIAAAMHEALASGATPVSVFDEVAKARGSMQCGLVAMVSVSIVLKAGGGGAGAVGKFVQSAKGAGFDGVIVPDCSLEESEPLRAAAAEHGLSFSLLVAPSTPPRRAEAIVKTCTGFVYLLARAGITGDSPTSPTGGAGPDESMLESRMSKLRQMTDLPIAVGFGISTPEHVRAVVQRGGADAAIVGSALVRRMGEAARGGGDPVAEAENFIRLLGQGLVAAAAPAQA